MTRVVRRSSRSNSSTGAGVGVRASTDHATRSRQIQPRTLSASNGYNKATSLSPHDSRSHRSLQPSNSESPQLVTHQDHLSSHRSPIGERLTPQTPESFQSLGSSTDSSYVMSNYGPDLAPRSEMRPYTSLGGGYSHQQNSNASHPIDPSFMRPSETVPPYHGNTFDTWTRHGTSISFEYCAQY